MIHLREGRNLVRLRIENLYLNPGVYRLDLWLANPPHARARNSVYDHIESAFEIEVVYLEAERLRFNPNSAVLCHFELVDVIPHRGEQDSG
jgi:lipopolysaccharide transport system ATP-binding protein